ncbi:MAG: 16S rRNA (uracil(1498)-N(3))-methyltransferase [Proteobacteria bacterium]|nr:16S rRNA (uracil(1498)-N(3))-methyltransferase [Pseudomonadota bacterium]MBU1738520.1 16S rRNA (uracil(1498)-N(3))-methyltransferase [Pseudomonadota bacterium]
MNLILLEQNEINGTSVVLADRRAKHLRKVLRVLPGDTVRVGIVNGPMGSGTVREIDQERVALDLEIGVMPTAPPPLCLVLALPRPIMLKRVLAQATSLGVSEIHLIMAGRVEKSFFKASLLEKESLRDCLKLGLEQAVDTRLPIIQVHRKFKPFAEDLLPEIAANYPIRLLAHPDPESGEPRPVFANRETPALVAIGPEGGWVDFEVDLFRKQGLETFSLGPRILRVDTAVPAILSQILLLRELAAD